MTNNVAMPREDNKPIVLGMDHTRYNNTGNTVATVVKSLTIPGGSMGPNGMLRVATLWSWNNSAGSKTVQVKLGGVVIYGTAGTTTTGIEILKSVRNRGAENAQIIHNVATLGTVGTTAITTASVDTSVDQTLDFVVTLATGTDNAALESFLVEVISGR